MKPSTPRRSRRQNQPATRAGNTVPVSDYESDGPSHRGPNAQFSQSTVTVTATATVTAGYHGAQPAQGGTRTIGDMNLSVIKRYVPTVQSYISMAHHVLVFQWDHEKEDWGEELFKGPLFICNQLPDMTTGAPLPRACIFLINRNSPENFTLDLATVLDCQQNDSQKDFLEIYAATPSTDAVHWGLLIRESESLDDTWAALQDRWRAVQTIPV
ncbi:hypothetical protein M406DRAFT_109460 [Cryphonectria parasitica EP155]|uniref:Uncharacterized protein n=1 Tax=Cryphonectria parasitica (strain ATCC 38755 / EP155) TaxID=660469 RepID=A0A9P4XTB4_CRYP1|nr:uncharacterized protein M406DRAFT_109460 [Cryphonectria parasitica EP155]KAF3760390.1 hypothetical protein M406DRAFT_109460 [Cryphonectria parasitica EP155]